MASITSSTQANHGSVSSNIETNQDNASSTTDHSTERTTSYAQDQVEPGHLNQQASTEDNIYIHTTQLQRYLQEFDESMAGCEITEAHPSSAIVDFAESVVATDGSVNGSANSSQSRHSSATSNYTNRINYYLQDPTTSVPEESPYFSSPAEQIIKAHTTKIQNNLVDFDKNFYK